MAKEARHKRLYKDSPKLERGEDGNMKSTKPSEKEKESDKTQAGVDDVKMDDVEPSEDARMQEIKDMHSRHQKEMESVHKRHQKEDVKKYAEKHHNSDNNEEDGAGDREIEEVRKGEKITE